MIDCQNWKPNHTTWAGGGECVAGVYLNPSAGTCARCPSRVPLASPADAPLVQVDRQWSFGELWELIHGDPTGSPALIDLVRSKLPCGECSRHFVDYLTVNPPVYGPGWTLWGFELHNAVNRRIGKPEMSWTDFAASRRGKNA